MSELADKKISMLVWNDFRNDARVLKEAETLQAKGARVTVFALQNPGLTPKFETLESGVHVSRIGKALVSKPRSVAVNVAKLDSVGIVKIISLIFSRLFAHLKFVWMVALSRADVVHIHDVNMLPTGWLASLLSRSKVVYDAHEVSTGREGYRKVKKLVAWVESKLMPRVDGVITTTRMRAKFFSRAYSIPTPVVLQNRPALIAAPVNNKRLHRELGLENGRKVVLYQGGLQAGRGLEILLEASQDFIGDTAMVFVGGGRLLEKLRDQSRKLGLEGRVFFIPTVSLAELPDYTASADVAVQPIENTCFNHFSTDSNKLFEYAMAGVPLVASNLPEIRAVVEQYNLGLLFEPSSSEALVRSVNQLLVSDTLRANISLSAKEVNKELSWLSQEQKLLELYERVLSPEVA